jgi:hypothetical protein
VRYVTLSDRVTLLAAFLFAYWSYSSTLKMEALRSSETSVSFYQTIPREIREDSCLLFIVAAVRTSDFIISYFCITLYFFSSIERSYWCSGEVTGIPSSNVDRLTGYLDWGFWFFVFLSHYFQTIVAVLPRSIPVQTPNKNNCPQGVHWTRFAPVHLNRYRKIQNMWKSAQELSPAWSHATKQVHPQSDDHGCFSRQ